MHLNEKARGIVNVCERLSYIGLDVKVLLTELIRDHSGIGANPFKDVSLLKTSEQTQMECNLRFRTELN